MDEFSCNYLQKLKTYYNKYHHSVISLDENDAKETKKSNLYNNKEKNKFTLPNLLLKKNNPIEIPKPKKYKSKKKLKTDRYEKDKIRQKINYNDVQKPHTNSNVLPLIQKSPTLSQTTRSQSTPRITSNLNLIPMNLEKDEEYLKIKCMDSLQLEQYIEFKISNIDRLFDKFNISNQSEKLLRKRKKFIEECQKQIGTPYRQDCQNDEDKEFQAKEFLDCCGLVRKAFNSSSDTKLLRQNQSQMQDTLPNNSTLQDLLPGDLIFWEGIQHSKENWRPKHNIVHVEVQMGPHHETIGARWKRGQVQEQKSQKFASSAYKIVNFQQKSIDLWLNGDIKSWCILHQWRSRLCDIGTTEDERKTKDKDIDKEKETEILSDNENEEDHI